MCPFLFLHHDIIAIIEYLAWQKHIYMALAAERKMDWGARIMNFWETYRVYDSMDAYSIRFSLRENAVSSKYSQLEHTE